jgi:hypothetical protein
MQMPSPIDLRKTQWNDLGAGPFVIHALSNPVRIAIGDTSSDQYQMVLLKDEGPTKIESPLHIFACALTDKPTSIGYFAGLGSTSNPLLVATPLSAPVSGQKVIAATGTAVSIGSNALVNGVVIKAAATNSSIIFVGGPNVNTTNDGTGNGYPLEAGEAISYAVSALGLVYINGVLGDFICFAGN